MREWIGWLEERLVALDKPNLIALYVLTFALILGGGYYLLFDPLMQQYERNEQNIEKLRKKLARHDPKHLEYKIAFIKKEILKLKDEIERLRLQKIALQEELAQKRYAILTQKGLSQFLDIMLQKSVKKRVLVHEVSIEDRNRQVVGELYERKRVVLLFNGAFIPSILFLRETEAMPYLFNIDEFNLTKSESGVEGRVSILFYGAKR